ARVYFQQLVSAVDFCHSRGVYHQGYDGAKADIWSCGVILYVLLAGFLPFQDDNLVAMYKKIYRGDFKCPPWFSPEARRLISKLLDPNPKT
ncbi:hypothetical protein Godav_004083, partial [Gossypium davidsonii]|nr:hypothetical protein [Gossypium davidsonii]